MILPQLERGVAAALDEAAAALSGARRLAVACHIGPDGDALGSILAVALALGAAGVDVVAGWPADVVEVPTPYTFLPGRDLLVPAAELDADIFLALDCASADRLERVLPVYERAAVRINIDHHVSNTRFGTLNVVDADAPSCSELVLHLLERMALAVSPEVATCLYTGLVTDTGRFGYASATPRAHAAAARLIELGVEVDAVNQAVFESLPYGYLKTLGVVLGRCELADDPPLVVTWLSQDDLRSTGISLDETDGLIDVVRTTRESDVTAILKELESGLWKVSLRSKGSTDVGAIAQRLGGGGHTLAAGYTSTVALDESIEQIRRELRASSG